jgi:hypothetical protein
VKKLLFLLLVLAISQITFTQNPVPNPNWQLKTEDTYMTIAVVNNNLQIIELKNPLQGWNWTPKPTNVPLLNRVVAGLKIYSPDWTYKDAVVDNSNGYTVTLRFTSTSPNLELKSSWRAQPGPGPVENWMTVKNKSGADVTYSTTSNYQTYSSYISAARLEIVSNNIVNLHSFIKNAWWGQLSNEQIGKYSNISKNNEFIPFIILDVGSAHGLYIGYEWELGGFNVRSFSDPLSISVSAYPITENITQGNNEIFTIPNVYYGTYQGDIDDGSNKFKKWFWNYKITRSMYNNSDEPWTQVCVGPNGGYWSPNITGTTPQSSYDSIAAIGVEMVKLDFWDGTGGNWYTNQDWMYHSKVWPYGFDYAKKAHNAGLKASLYMGGTYNNLDLTQTAARDSQLAALLWRYDHGWFDMWRTDQYYVPEEPMPQTYAGVTNFLYIQDSLIKSRPGYRYENACNNYPYKGFAICRRMTFCTMVDVPFNAEVTRSLYYINSYAINPVQLKSDHGGLTAYDLRTDMLGSILGSIEDNALCRQHISLYKNRQRPILRGGDVYHILPIADGINWDGLEYFNTKLNKGSVFLFKPSKSAIDGNSKVIRLKGLNRSAEYTLVFQDRTNLNCVMTGARLMDHGIAVSGMNGDHASEIIWIDGTASQSKN